MTNHPELLIRKSTTPTEVAKFINDTSLRDSASGKWHLRARETTYKTPDGQSCTVKILFVRSGRQNPVAWFKSLWNRARQYKLAREVLQSVAGPAIGAGLKPVDYRNHNIDYASALRLALASNADKSLTLASLSRTVNEAKPGYRPYMHFEQSDITRLAEFFTIRESEMPEFKKTFMDFKQLARKLHTSGHSIETHPALIEKHVSLYCLLPGAASFTRFWQRNNSYHAGTQNSALLQIDQFAIWLTENCLPDQKGLRSSSPVFQSYN